MKIAIRAFRLAERDLYVDAKAGHLHKNFNTAPHCAQAAVGVGVFQSVLIRNNFYLQVSLARPIEFAKEDTLPAT